jgi:Leucine-rich repeat (LRR) protein
MSSAFNLAQVTELKPLAGLSNLKEFDLSNTQVTELKPLADLSNRTDRKKP